jgi:maltooligosyltrehalose trehalohydrolase
MPAGGAHFRVWAPRRNRVEVVLENGPAVELRREDGGYFSGAAAEAGNGSRHRYLLDGNDSFPDPISRFQPEGPHGASEVIDPSLFRWTDENWGGVALEGQVIYELHVGSFTQEGTWEPSRSQ